MGFADDIKAKASELFDDAKDAFEDVKDKVEDLVDGDDGDHHDTHDTLTHDTIATHDEGVAPATTEEFSGSTTGVGDTDSTVTDISEGAAADTWGTDRETALADESLEHTTTGTSGDDAGAVSDVYERALDHTEDIAGDAGRGFDDTVH